MLVTGHQARLGCSSHRAHARPWHCSLGPTGTLTQGIKGGPGLPGFFKAETQAQPGTPDASRVQASPRRPSVAPVLSGLQA